MLEQTKTGYRQKAADDVVDALIHFFFYCRGEIELNNLIDQGSHLA